MARPKKMTRAEMISTLKSRGQKGALSKMTKPQLRALLEKTAPPGEHSHGDKPKSELALEPDEQGGGHYFRKNGKTVSDGAHDHKKDLRQRGSVQTRVPPALACCTGACCPGRPWSCGPCIPWGRCVRRAVLRA